MVSTRDMVVGTGETHLQATGLVENIEGQIKRERRRDSAVTSGKFDGIVFNPSAHRAVAADSGW